MQCKGQTKSGNQCKNSAVEFGFCKHHEPSDLSEVISDCKSYKDLHQNFMHCDLNHKIGNFTRWKLLCEHFQRTEPKIEKGKKIYSVPLIPIDQILAN